MSIRKPFCRGIALVIVLGLISPLRAAPTGDANAAREHFRKGTQFYDLQRFDEAAQEYEAAYQAKEDPALLYNIGQAYRQAKKYEKAEGAFKAFLRYVPGSPNRAKVEALIAEMQKLAADEKQRLEAERRAAEEQKRLAEQQERERASAEAQARAAQVGQPQAPVRTPDHVAAGRARTMKIAGIAVAAVGGVALVAGAGLLGGAGAIASTYNGLSASSDTEFVAADEARWKAFRTGGLALVAVGAAAAIAGAAVAIIGARREKEARMTFAPWLGNGTAGLGVAGAW